MVGEEILGRETQENECCEKQQCKVDGRVSTKDTKKMLIASNGCFCMRHPGQGHNKVKSRMGPKRGGQTCRHATRLSQCPPPAVLR